MVLPNTDGQMGIDPFLEHFLVGDTTDVSVIALRGKYGRNHMDLVLLRL